MKKGNEQNENIMEQINLNEMIAKVALITLAVLMFIFSLVTVLLTFFYPAKLASVASSLGLTNVSIFYYEKNYEKTQDINDLYKLLNQTVLVNKYEKTVSNFEKLYDNNSEVYYEFIDYLNEYYMNSTQNVFLQIYLTNEDLRLKQSYIKALFKIEEYEKAFLFMLNDLQNEQFVNINDYAKLNFLGAAYVFELNKLTFNPQDYENLESCTINSVEVNYLQEAISYYNNIKDIYDFNLFVREENENSFELSVICNHLLKTATTILFVTDLLESSLDTTLLEGHLNDYSMQYSQLINELEMLQQ